MHCADGDSGDSVGYRIHPVTQVSKGTVDLGDGGEVTALVEGPRIGLSCESVNHGHVIHLHRKGVAFEKMAKIIHSMVNTESSRSKID